MFVTGKVSFHGLNDWKLPASIAEEIIKIEALGRSAGPVQNVIMALPNAHSWKAIREELKRCFSDQTSLGHAATQLENMDSKAQ